MTDLHALRFPIGEFKMPKHPLGSSERTDAIERIAQTPAKLRGVVAGFNEIQLDTQYRPDGWTVRQVVHHLPDSHVNAYMRLKLALTEERPTIRTYEEARWAKLPDAAGPIDMSLELLDAIHERFVYLWRRLEREDWNSTLLHPELGEMRVDALAAMYAWHGDHHIAHITSLRDREGWD